MQPSPAAVALAKASESLRLVAYPDQGTGAEPWTIGWGHTNGVYEGMSITVQQAEEFLAADIAEAAATVLRAVTVPLSQGELDALTDFVFNIGPGKLGVKDGFVTLKRGGQSTLLRLINAGQKQAAAEQFKFWVMANGKPLAGLITRRAAEKQLFLSNPLATSAAVTQASK
jgi:lysozyme